MSERRLHCPGCSSPMVEIDVRGVALDRCPACLGLWFDVGEFADAARCQVPPLQVHQASERRCPCCRSHLKLARLGPAVVDWCEPCRGIYIDAGVFALIVKGRPPLPTKAFDPWLEPRHSATDTLDTLATVGILGAILGAGD